VCATFNRRTLIRNKKPNSNELDSAGTAHRPAAQPATKDWSWLDAISGPLDPDMVEATLGQPPEQHRPGLDKLFPE
jgi:hypothetical protein